MSNWKFDDENDEWVNMAKYTRVSICADPEDATWNVVAYKNYNDEELDGDILFCTHQIDKDDPSYYGMEVARRWMKDFMRS